jgi:hypothetical protein
MRLLFRRLMHTTGRQLRHVIGAAINPPTRSPGPSLMTALRFHLSLRCWLSGHEDFVRTAAGRLYLECMECGRQTTGWRTGKGREPREAGRIDGAPGAVGCARTLTPGNRAALKVA